MKNRKIWKIENLFYDLWLKQNSIWTYNSAEQFWKDIKEKYFPKSKWNFEYSTYTSN